MRESVLTQDEHRAFVAETAAVLRGKMLTTQWVIQRGNRVEVMGDRMPSHPVLGSYSTVEEERALPDWEPLTVMVTGERSPVVPFAGASVVTISKPGYENGTAVTEVLKIGLLNGDDALRPETYRLSYVKTGSPADTRRVMMLGGNIFYSDGGEVLKHEQLVALGLAFAPMRGAMSVWNIPEKVLSFAVHDSLNPDFQLESLAAYPNAQQANLKTVAYQMLLDLRLSEKVRDVSKIPYSKR